MSPKSKPDGFSSFTFEKDAAIIICSLLALYTVIVLLPSCESKTPLIESQRMDGSLPVDDFVKKHPDIAKAFNSLGTLRFLSTVKICDAIVGNSSSGILEAPSLFTPTINIGDKKKGRTQASSIINVDNSEEGISSGFELVKKIIAENKLSEVKNPYDNEGAAQEILNKILDYKIIQTNKSFYNLS